MKKIITIFVALLVCCSLMAQSDVKEVVLSRNMALSKCIKGGEKKTIKTLVLSGNGRLSREDLKFLEKMQNLETLDCSGFGRAYQNDFDTRNYGVNDPAPILHIKRLILNAGQVRGTTDYEDDNDGFGEYSKIKWVQGYKPTVSARILPDLEELVLTNVMPNYNGFAPDSLYENRVCEDGFIPVYLLKSGMVVFKKGVEYKKLPKEKRLTSFVISKETTAVANGVLTIPSTVGYVAPLAFYGLLSIKTIKIEDSDQTLYIGDGAFSGCSNIQVLECDRPVYAVKMYGLTHGAFSEATANKVVFNKQTILGNVSFEHIGELTLNGTTTITGMVSSSIDNLKVSGSLRASDRPFRKVKSALFKESVSLPTNAFETLEEVVFEKKPTLANNFVTEYAGFTNITYPEGAEESVANVAGKKYVASAGRKHSYNIQLEKPGTILSVIPRNDLNIIDSLTITGFLYDTDLKVLNDCRHLRYLDIRKTYIVLSPETSQDRQAEAAFFGAMGSLMGAAADAKYADRKMNTLDYVLAKGFTKLMEDEGKVKKAEEMCIIPTKSFYGNENLETVLLPYRCSKIERDAFKYCKKLKNLQLPLYLKTIETGCFAHCYALREVDFPASISDFGGRSKFGYADDYSCAFGNSGLEKIDLSKCKFDDTTWKCDLHGCKNLKELRLPSNIKTIEELKMTEKTHVYIPASVTYLGGASIYIAHFIGTTPPSSKMWAIHQNSTIYVPKGSLTGYYAKFGGDYKYIEE